MKTIRLFFVGFLAFIHLCTLSFGAPHIASTKHVPWSGYWWSMLNGELALGWRDGQDRQLWTEKEVIAFDECLPSYTPACLKLMDKMGSKNGSKLSPLMKFDLALRKFNEKLYDKGGAPESAFSHAARWELQNHYIGDNSSHRYWDARGFSGKCIGWALSTMDYNEPTVEREIEGVKFTPADIKGLLATLYNGAQFFVPAELFIGNPVRASGSSQADYEDVLPHDFLKALVATIDKNQMLEADLDPGPGVWNYPIFKYELTYKAGRGTKVEGDLTIYFANDEVEIDGVFSTHPARPDLKSRHYTFEMFVPSSWNGNLAKISKSSWTGESVDNHPDALILGLEKNWRQEIYQYKNTSMKTEVNFQLLKRINTTGNKWVAFVDMLLSEYYGK